MKRMIKASVTIDLDYPESGTLELHKTGESHSIFLYDGLIWRDVYEANDGSLWMKIDNIWKEVIPHSTGFVPGKRRCDLRRSKEEKDRERERLEDMKNGGFNPLAGI